MISDSMYTQAAIIVNRYKDYPSDSFKGDNSSYNRTVALEAFEQLFLSIDNTFDCAKFRQMCDKESP